MTKTIEKKLPKEESLRGLSPIQQEVLYVAITQGKTLTAQAVVKMLTAKDKSFREMVSTYLTQYPEAILADFYADKILPQYEN